MPAIVACATVAISSVATAATTFTVDDNGPADFSSIQAAIDAASDGDTILVSPGTYTSSNSSVVEIQGKSLTVESVGGKSQTFLDGENVRRVLTVKDSPGTTLNGFTIMRGMANPFGGGIHSDQSTLTIAHSTVGNCTATYGAGMLATNSSVTLAGTTFHDNTATNRGSSVYSFECILQIAGCSFRRNTCASGGAVEIDSPVAAAIFDSYFCSNTPNHTFGFFTDLGKNQFEAICPELLAIGWDFVLELAVYIRIPPCDPLAEMEVDMDPHGQDEIGQAIDVAVTPGGQVGFLDLEGIVHAVSPDDGAYLGALFQSDFMQAPVAIAFDDAFGYVADEAGQIHAFNASNGQQTGLMQSELLQPVDLAAGADGVLWATSSNAAAGLQAWDPRSGEMHMPFSGEFPGFDQPGAVTVLPDGSPLVVDQADSEIYLFDIASGAVSKFLSAEDSEKMGFGTIRELKCLPDNRVYILSDRGVTRYTQGGWFMEDLPDDTGVLAGMDLLVGFGPDPDPWRPADFDRNGLVDGADLARLLGAWGSEVVQFDLSQDGIVGGADLAMLLGDWG